MEGENEKEEEDMKVWAVCPQMRQRATDRRSQRDDERGKRE